MKILIAVVGCILLLAVAAFCLFGFLASFERTETPRIFFAFWIGYTVIGTSCIAGIVWLILMARRK